MPEAVIVETARSPIGRALKDVFVGLTQDAVEYRAAI